MSKQNETYCVVFRVGGTENFQWKRSLAMQRTEAEKALESTRRMGYECFLNSWRNIQIGGLPETYSPSDDIPGNSI